MTSEKKDLGNRIRHARAAKGWKQKHLAAQVDVEPITAVFPSAPNIELRHWITEPGPVVR